MASKSLTLSSLAAAVTMLMMMMFAVASSEQAQAPAVDCSNVILNLADCLSYVTNGSTTEKPEGTCCSGLKTVLKAAPECLCEGFKSSAQFGVVLNVTKAFQLPAACGVSAPSATKCALSDTPSAAPALTPSQQSSSAPSGDASGISSGNSQAPSPSPRGHTGSAAFISFPVGSMLVGLVVASLSCF